MLAWENELRPLVCYIETALVKRSKNFLLRATTVALGIVMGVAAVELALRIMGYSSPQFYEADVTLGYKLIPSMTGWYTREGRSFVTINSDGFHDFERVVEKPPDVFRIAVIGDSYVEALQVGREASFINFIASDRDAFGGKRVEVLPFGVSGYGTAQELILLREKVLRYSPDIVMLVMTTNNDITDNVRELKRTPIPYFVLRDDKLVLDDSFLNEQGFQTRSSSLSGAGTWFENRLRFVQAIREISRKIKDRDRGTAFGAAQLVAAAAPAGEVGIDSEVYREPADDAWRTAWRVTEALIVEMNREAAASGAKFVVVTASNGVQVLPNVAERDAFAKFLGVDDLFYPDRRIAQFCTANSIASITLSPFLADHSDREKVNLHGFEGNIGYGHWNQLGHRVAGEEIGRRLRSEVFR